MPRQLVCLGITRLLVQGPSSVTWERRQPSSCPEIASGSPKVGRAGVGTRALCRERIVLVLW